MLRKELQNRCANGGSRPSWKLTKRIFYNIFTKPSKMKSLEESLNLKRKRLKRRYIC